MIIIIIDIRVGPGLVLCYTSSIKSKGRDSYVCAHMNFLPFYYCDYMLEEEGYE